MSTVRAADAPAIARPAFYLALTKPDVTLLVVLTTFGGFYLGSPSPMDVGRLLHTLCGTTLMAAGTAALNHYLERGSDACMRRTAQRPLPLGQLQPGEALWFGSALVLAGAACLALLVNVLSSLLGLLTSVAYLGVYTPLKKRTTLAAWIGSLPGAVPPLIGWAGARGSLDAAAWVLFGILFFWQFPHFLAIAWLYRKDYARAGIRMLSVADPAGSATFGQIVFTAAALVPTSLLLTVVGLTGIPYFFGSLLLGMALVQVALWAARSKSSARTRWLMHATMLYIPLWLVLAMLDKVSR
jgi:protoheme IX farnesyltransferase